MCGIADFSIFGQKTPSYGRFRRLVQNPKLSSATI
jgi:hypothetical protein